MKWIITTDATLAVRSDQVTQLAITSYQRPEGQRWWVEVYVQDRGIFTVGDFTDREAAIDELRHLLSQLQEAENEVD